MAEYPIDPAAGSAPVSRRAARVPGRPSPSGPLEGEGGYTSRPGEPLPGTPGRDPSSPAASTELALFAAAGPTSPQRSERAGAPETPDPGTAEADPATASRLPVSAGRGTDTSPAGGALEGARGAPAGSTGRTYTIVLPAGMELLNANDRDGHWARRRRITGGLRETAGWAARAERIPALQRAYILGIYEPPDRRRRDPANLYPSFKACVDGLVDAGVLLDDDAAHLDGPDMRLGEVCPRGRLVLHITEVTQ